MRKKWTQFEVIEMAKLLGFKNFDRRALAYWTRMGIFAKPIADIKRVIVLYDSDDIEVGLVDIGRRMRLPVPITYEDVKWAKKEVLKTVKARNVSMFLRKLSEREKV